jgi:transposase
LGRAKLGPAAGSLWLMSDNKELYGTILGIKAPWYVTQVDVSAKREEVTVTITSRPDVRHACPTCGKPCPGYDTRRRSWRHLDTCQFKTILLADVPRVNCTEHGVLQITTPWAEPGSGFTLLMECLIIDWLLEANTSAVARRMRLTWDEIDGVKSRAVQRGLDRRQLRHIRRVAIDETSFQKRHEYVTVVTDLESKHVLHVGDGRTREALDEFWWSLKPAQLAQIEAVAMDMCPAYEHSARENVPGADQKICFDRFHVAQLLNNAVNKVRLSENHELAAAGEEVPKRTKYVWTQNPENMPRERRSQFEALRKSSLKAARAWAIKDMARRLWSYGLRGWAMKAWKRWVKWALSSRLEPMRHAARAIRDRLWGIVNAIVLKVTNAAAESINAKIQWIKSQACGFRNRERFRQAIYFHCGGLDLYPRPVADAHMKA